MTQPLATQPAQPALPGRALPATHRAGGVRRLVLAGLLASLSACSANSSSPPAPSCDDLTKSSGVCPGTSTQSVSQAMCTATVSVTDPASLGAAVSLAKPGTCLLLGAGSFPAIDLPAGVHVVGKGESATTVAGFLVRGGGSVIGALAASGAIEGAGTGALRLDQVRSSSVTGAGVNVEDLDLTVVDSTISQATVLGLAAGCSTRCKTDRPKVDLQRSLFAGNSGVGVWLHGVDAKVEYVEIRDTKPIKSSFGRGLDVSADATFTAKHFVVSNSAEAGLVATASTASLEDFSLARNGYFGLQLSAMKSATLTNFVLRENGGVGLLVDASQGIIVQGGQILDTKKLSMLTDGGGVGEVGDGMNWRGNSSVSVKATRFANSGRQAIIVQGKNSGDLDAKLEGTDATTGIIVQGLDTGTDSGIIVQGLTPKVMAKGSELLLAQVHAAK